jgi:hypothetical protein
MGRIADLLGEIAEVAEEGPEGLFVPPDTYDRLRDDWDEEDIDDALGLVRDSLMLSELVESADSLSTRMVEFLGSYADRVPDLEAGRATIRMDAVGQIARRVARLEDVLEAYREGDVPEHGAFDRLQEKLAVHGLEDMFEIPGRPDLDDDDEVKES